LFLYLYVENLADAKLQDLGLYKNQSGIDRLRAKMSEEGHGVTAAC